MKFSNIAHLKRDRRLEGETGIDLKISSDIFLTVLAASDANPKWTDKAQKAFAEMNRLRNSGAPDEKIDVRFAELFADTIVLGWHGGQDAEGNNKPGGPKDEQGSPVPFTRAACVAFLTEADDAVAAILGTISETKNYRAIRAQGVIEMGKSA